MNYKVLYIEDEENLAGIVKETMQLKGYIVHHRCDGTKILEVLRDFRPDICVLDVMLPYIDGFSLGKTIREANAQMPIIFLTAKGQTKDVLDGFASGGTDFIKKPFSMEELMARMDSQIFLSLKNINRKQVTVQQFILGSFTYFPDRMELRELRGSIIKLSNRETAIINIFCMHMNTAVDRRQIMKVVWGDDSYFTSRNLDVYIKRLRDYFAAGKGVEILTLKGVGYHFGVDRDH